MVDDLDKYELLIERSGRIAMCAELRVFVSELKGSPPPTADLALELVSAFLEDRSAKAAAELEAAQVHFRNALGSHGH